LSQGHKPGEPAILGRCVPLGRRRQQGYLSFATPAGLQQCNFIGYIEDAASIQAKGQ
jgi:hypothetical protein